MPETTIIEIMITIHAQLGWDINGLQPFYCVLQAQYKPAQRQRRGENKLIIKT